MTVGQELQQGFHSRSLAGEGMFRIYFDTNEEVDGPAGLYGLWLPTSIEDLEKMGDELRDGVRVIVYMSDELEAEAVLSYSEKLCSWVAKLQEDTVKYYR